MKLSDKKQDSSKPKVESPPPKKESISKEDVEKAHYLQVEDFILGHLMKEAKKVNSDMIFDVFEYLPEEAFNSPFNRALYSQMKHVFSQKGRLDTVVLIGELTKSKTLDSVGGGQRVIDLSVTYNPSTNLTTLTRELNEEYRRNILRQKLEEASDKLRRKDFSSVDAVIGEVDSQIYRLAERRNETVVDIVKATESLIGRANSIERYGLVGYSWGIGRLDLITSGIEPKKSYVVAAVKKAGKTKFLINTIRNLLKQKVPTLFLSMEMGPEAITAELISSVSEQSNNIFKANLEKDAEKLLRIASNKATEYISIDCQAFLSVAQIRHKIRAASQRGIKVVMLDYIQRMNFEFGADHNRRRTEASVIATAMANLADIGKEYGVAMIMLSQLANRAENVTPKISDVKESGGIAEAVDCIILIDNEDRRNGNYGMKTNSVNLIVEQRGGASGLVETIVDLSMSMYRDKAEPTREEMNWSGEPRDGQ